MIAKQDVFINKAGETYFEITADEHERQLAEAREDALRIERGRKRREESLKKDLAQSRQELAEKDREIEAIRKELAALKAQIAQLTQ